MCKHLSLMNLFVNLCKYDLPRDLLREGRRPKLTRGRASIKTRFANFLIERKGWRAFQLFDEGKHKKTLRKITSTLKRGGIYDRLPATPTASLTSPISISIKKSFTFYGISQLACDPSRSLFSISLFFSLARKRNPSNLRQVSNGKVSNRLLTFQFCGFDFYLSSTRPDRSGPLKTDKISPSSGVFQREQLQLWRHKQNYGVRSQLCNRNLRSAHK